MKYYDWSTADYKAMTKVYITGLDWLALLTTNLTADTLWAAYYSNVLQTAADLFVSIKYHK